MIVSCQTDVLAPTRANKYSEYTLKNRTRFGLLFFMVFFLIGVSSDKSLNTAARYTDRYSDCKTKEKALFE